MPLGFRRAGFILFLGMVFTTAVAPPGLCACWVNPAVADIHVHIGDPGPVHSHDYLLDSADGLTAVAALFARPDVLGLLLAAYAGAVLTRIAHANAPEFAWCTLVKPPPPKIIAG